jgi:dolichol-phosphate mannosyltransferase
MSVRLQGRALINCRNGVMEPSSEDSAFGLARVAVVLPAHNESRHLEAVVVGLPDWIDRIYIVDDASTDDTLDVARALPDPRVRVIHREANGGVGAAMRSGYEAALEEDCGVIVKMDADGQMDAGELAVLLAPICGGLADYVKGNRFRRSGRPADMPRRRWFGNVMLSFLTKVASGYWHVFDPQCGFTAITAATLSRLKLDGLATDYFFENDMLIRLNVIDARVVDVSTAALYGAETSGLRIGRILWTFPLRLLRRAAWRFIKRHVVNDFGAIAVLTSTGLLFTVFGVIFGAYHWIESFVSATPATAGTVMVAVLPIILGVQMLLQALILEVQGSPGSQETRVVARRVEFSGRLPSMLHTGEGSELVSSAAKWEPGE